RAGRVCRKCRKWKPFAEFYKNERCSLGHSTRCKRCMIDGQLAKYRQTTDKDFDLEQARQETEAKLTPRERKLLYWERWRNQKLLKGLCTSCGENPIGPDIYHGIVRCAEC